MKKLELVIIIFLIFLAGYICFFKLGHSYFENWDEGFYAQMTREMLRSRDWFILRWDNQVNIDKTPLNFWLNSFWASIFGLSEFSIRLTSAVSGFIVIIIVFLYVYQRWGFIPSLFAYSAIGLNNLFIWRSRTGNLDALLSLLILACFLLMTGKNKYRYFWLGLLFGLIYLQKSTIVFFPISVFLINELYHLKDFKKNLGNYLILILIFLSIAGLWLKIGTDKLGKDFFQYYVFRADQGVSRLAPSFFKTDYLSYTYYSLQRRLIYPFILGTIFLLINFRQGKKLVLFVFSWALIVLLSFTQRKNNWYLVPAMPFWAITIGYGVEQFLTIAQKIKIKRMSALFIMALLLYISYKTLTVNIASIVNMESSIHEVRSAKMAKELTRPDDKILRLDHAYPVTLYYSDRETYFHTTIDQGLFNVMSDKNIKLLIGKKEMTDEFEKQNKIYKYRMIDVGDEKIVRILGKIE